VGGRQASPEVGGDTAERVEADGGGLLDVLGELMRISGGPDGGAAMGMSADEAGCVLVAVQHTSSTHPSLGFSVSSGEAARGWARSPCRHFKNQSC
jgi:hypothetical protein